ncbi:MAG: amidohydrolase family protein [Gemmatimonadetes bacterium]|nr:amidohydrolase family protein [Gemmatimonadota bacterium]
MCRPNSDSRSLVLTPGLLLVALLFAAACAPADQGGANATVFEGARLIVGDGSAAIEDAVFVVEGDRFTLVGPRGEVDVPRGAARVDLTGKTVMPAIINTHMHLPTEREALITQLQHNAYYGAGTVVSLGLDNTDAPFQVRGETVPNGARYFTAGRGITSLEPGRSEAPYWVTSEAEARTAVQELAAKQVDVVKIWVDDRNGQYQKLGPALYGAVIDEAHTRNLRVTAHIFALEDAKGLLRAGLDAFAHSVRDQDVDDEFMAMIREHPNFVQIPNLPGRGVPTDLNWLSTIPPTELQEIMEGNVERPQAQAGFGIQARNLARLSGAGVKVAMGTDGGNAWAAHVEMEDMAAAGMTPAQVITAATSTSAEWLQLPDVGTVATGKIADFLVLDANPLDDITNTRRINAVYLRGTAVDREAVRARVLGQTTQ